LLHFSVIFPYLTGDPFLTDEYYNLTDDPTYYKRKKREWYLKNKEKVTQQSQAWKAANPERFEELQVEWRKNNPHRIKVYTQRSKRKIRLKNYGLTSEQFEQMVQDQNNLCAICEQPCSSGKLLAIDHNHKTGKVRGLLCTRCNVRLGMIENVQAMRFKLRPFLRYLKKHGDYR
jgi:hypothetical protein